MLESGWEMWGSCSLLLGYSPGPCSWGGWTGWSCWTHTLSSHDQCSESSYMIRDSSQSWQGSLSTNQILTNSHWSPPSVSWTSWTPSAPCWTVSSSCWHLQCHREEQAAETTTSSTEQSPGVWGTCWCTPATPPWISSPATTWARWRTPSPWTRCSLWWRGGTSCRCSLRWG